MNWWNSDRHTGHAGNQRHSEQSQSQSQKFRHRTSAKAK
jgi:hypothetical protein